MRKLVRDQIDELFGTVKEAFKHIKRLTGIEDAHAMLVDCFAAVESGEAALKGQLSEKRFAFYEEGIGKLKSALEDANDALSEGKPLNSALKEAEAVIKKIRYELSHETEVTIEIAFLPYKASMWDSFASIYRAAKDNPRCECHVVPISYYERNIDHSFGRLVYEGDLFPSDISTVHYDKYSLEQIRPDVIFIHNPYDDNNYVTSVHPVYYTSRLKEYTDFLVYVPYYVAGLQIEKTMISLPSFRNIDCIVLQSQEIAKAYREIIPEKKIAVLGSPKFDEVFYYQKNPPETPNEWRKIINDKKVVLYNTSLGSLLKGGEQYLKKLKNVFDAFENQDDLVLFWRPHPLSQNTIASMRPELAAEYRRLQGEYIRKGFGIFDDSTDVHRAIEMADFYYGDPSSLVYLFGATGKPVIYQNINLCEPIGNESRLRFHRFHFSSGNKASSKIWFLNIGGNAIFEADIQEKTAEYKGLLSVKTPTYKLGPMHDMEMTDDRIIFSSRAGNGLILYDTVTGGSEDFPLKAAYLSGNPYFQLTESCFRYNDSLFIIPNDYKAIVEFNIKNKSVKYHTNCLKELIANKEKLGVTACVRNDKALIPINTNNAVMEFDPRTGESRVIRVGDEADKWFGIAFDGKYCWLMPYSSGTDPARSAIARWDCDSNSIKKFNNYPKGFSIQERFKSYAPFFCAENYNEYMIFIPHDANMAVKLNKNTGEITAINELPRFDDNFTVNRPFSYPIISGDDLYIYAIFNNTFYKVNLNTQGVKSNKFNITDADKVKIAEDIFDMTALNNNHPSVVKFQIREAALPSGLVDSLKMLPSKMRVNGQLEVMKAYAVNLDGTSGEKILEHIIKNALA